MIDLLLANNRDITDIVSSLRIQSHWNNGATTLTFEYPTDKMGGMPNGCVVIYIHDKTNLFYGWLFKSTQSKDNFKCVCYDQLRYLKASNSIMRQVQTLDSFVNDVCAQVGDRIRMGRMEKTEIKLNKYLFDNKSHLDMIYQSIQDNLLMNGYYYTLRDVFGAIELRDTFDLRLPLVLGDGSFITDFDYTNSIDDDTYNYIKVAVDDKKKGVRDVYIAQNTDSISKWGKLMLYDKVTSEMNSAQLKERAETLLKLKNRETESLTVECRGNIRCQGGNGVKIEIKQANLNTWAIIQSATHDISKNIHTMKLELLFGRIV